MLDFHPLALTRRIATATLAIATFAIFSALITNSFQKSYADDSQFGAFTYTGDLSFTISDDSPCVNYDTVSSELRLAVRNGSIAADCLTATISTDNIFGYTLSIVGPSSGELESSDSRVIQSTTGTMESPAVFATQTSGGAWGFAIPNGQIQGFDFDFDFSYQTLGSTNTTNTARYAAVPTIPTAFTQTTTATTTPDAYNIYFAVAAGSLLTSGEYSGQITISAAANLPIARTGDFIQSVALSNCPATRTRVADARDGNTYWIRLIGDLCWMETNLAYAGGGSNLYGDAIFLTQGRSNTPTAPLFDIPPGANPTAATTDPSLSTDGGATNPQYGYLYNWCAAMGNQPDACQTSTAAQPDPNISVCPAGWRLPTGDPTTGEFTTLVDQLGWTSGAPTPLLTNGLYMYAGYFWNGSFNDQGSSGSYWSSTVTNAANAFYLTFVTGGVNPAGSNSKGYGLSVRCVSDAAEPAEPLPSPAPAPTGADIQRITLDGTLGNYSCPTTRTRVRDARDGSTYWVRRINGTQAGGGDLCWMETNLAYAGGGTNTYGDAIPAMTLGNSHTTSTQACYGNNPAVVANPTTRCYWNPTGSNRTTGTTDPSTSTNGGATNPQYGYFYNWCTAMNLQAAACQSSTATQPNQSVNGGTGAGATGSTLYNICPSGWRLPTGNTGGEFTLLNNAINSGSLTTPAGLLANGLYMYAGYFADGAFSNQGSFGYSWSSTVDSATNAFRLYFGSTFVDPAYAVSKGRGVPLRCVAP